jgi:methylated-DNA-[protein]-cysteine S-methyltransferase
VVGAAGQLTGYAGGLDRKRRLLELEGALAPGLTAVTQAR